MSATTRRELLLSQSAAVGAVALVTTSPQAWAKSGESDLLAAWRELHATCAAYNADPDADVDGPIWHRIVALQDQIDKARPTDLAGLAVQARYLANSLDMGSNEMQPELADAIGDSRGWPTSRSGGPGHERNENHHGDRGFGHRA